MNAPVIITIIVLIILVSIVIVFVGQARERAKIERIRKINSFQDKYRRLKRISDELPPQYLAKEIKMLLLDRAIDTLRELEILQKQDFKFAASLEADIEMSDLIKQANYKPEPIPITDDVQAKEIQGLLEAVKKFIEAQKKKGNIDTSSAKKNIQLINYYEAKSKADFYANKAKANIKNGKLRLAIHNYHNAVSELESVVHLTVAQKAIKAYKIRIKELDKMAEDEKKQENAKPDNIDSEWKSFMGADEDPWKKKNAYDD